MCGVQHIGYGEDHGLVVLRLHASSTGGQHFSLGVTSRCEDCTAKGSMVEDGSVASTHHLPLSCIMVIGDRSLAVCPGRLARRLRAV